MGGEGLDSYFIVFGAYFDHKLFYENDLKESIIDAYKEIIKKFAVI